MADIFVSMSGNDSNNGATRATAVRHIWKGVSKLRAGDTLVVTKLAIGTAIYGPEASPGTAAPHRGVTIPSNCTIRFEDDVVLDQQNEYEYGFLNASGGSENFKLLYVRVRNCGAGITARAKNFEIGYCDIRNTSGNGISINGGKGYGSDGGWIHDNYLEDCVLTDNYRSAISILESVAYADVPLRTEEPGIPGRPGGGWGFIVADNVIVNTGYVGRSNGDSNGIILDLFYNPDGARTNIKTSYSKHSLVTRNLVLWAAGCGIKTTNTRYAHVYRNTTYANKRNAYLNSSNGQTNANAWQGELANYHGSGDNEWRENICVSTTAIGGVFVMAKFNHSNGESAYYTDSGYVWSRNLGYNTGSTRLGHSIGSNPKPMTPASGASPGTAGYFEADPKFVGPVAKPASSPALGGGLAFYRPRFALQASSPAIGKGADGGDLGAFQTSTPPPVTVLTLVTAPVMEILGSPLADSDPSNPVYPVGATVRFKVGVYNVTPTSRSDVVQWWNGATYEAKTVTISGPESGWYSFPAPDVTKKGGLQIKETASDGTTTLNPTSNWIDIAPAPVVTETKPENRVLPVISPNPPVIGSAATCPTGTWDGTTPMTFARQWKWDGANIPGATGASYTPVLGDKGKALSCDVTATNSVGSTTVTTVATSPVVDPTELTLAQVTAELRAAQADILALRSDLNAQVSRNDTQDGDIAEIEGRLGDRIGTIELDTGGLRDRLGAVEGKLDSLEIDGDVGEIRAALYDLQQKMDEVERVVGRFSVTGRVRLHPRQ